MRLRPGGISAAESADDHRRTTVESVAARLRAGAPDRKFILGAFANGRLAGIAGFYRHETGHFRHKGHIWGVYVAQDLPPPRRGPGAAPGDHPPGSQHPRHRADQSRCLAPQLPAKELYASLGFQTYGVERRSLKIGDGYVDDELMALDLVE